MQKDPNDEEKEKKPDLIPLYLITGIYTAFTAWVLTFYILDRKMILMLSPVIYLFWYMLLFFTE